MAGVDNRIVTMQFNNRDFEQNARTSMSTLQKLKESMNFRSIVSGATSSIGAIGSALTKLGLRTPFAPLIRGAQTGLATIGGVLDKIGIKNPFVRSVDGAAELQKAAQTAAGPAGMGALDGAVTGVSAKFIALSTIAITALSNITNRAINAGTSFAKSFSVGPIIDGLHEYETNLKSIQVIQSNTDRPLKEVEESLQELNRYSDLTIYNFSEMAKNIGTFTAAGVDLKTAVSSIKGIANIAALSGSNSQQAATAMYQLSQAISSGKVGLMDWNSVVNAGMGGKKLQNALAQTAIAMGDLNKEQVKLVGPMKKLEIMGGSFRESIMAKPGQEAWLTSDILVNTLAVMDGRFSSAALAAEKTETGLQKYTKAQIAASIADSRAALEKKNGVKYTDEQFAALQKMSTAAFKAATEVKTLGQVFDVAKETIASGWSASFVNIFGNKSQATKLFTGMSEGLNLLINQNALARNKLLEAWSGSELGGRATLIQGLKNAWEALLGVLGPIKDGFRDIFPAKTVGDLRGMTLSFALFTAKLKPSEETMANIRDIAAGMFSVLSIGKTIFMGIVGGVKALVEASGAGEGNILSFAASIGRAVTEFDVFLKQSGIVSAFFESMGNLLSIPLSLLQGVASAIGALFDGFNIGKASAATGAISDTNEGLSVLQSTAEGIRNVFEGLSDLFSGLGEALGRAAAKIGEVMASFLTSASFEPALAAINTGLFAALVAAVTKFITGDISFDFTGGLFGQISGVLTEVTGSLGALQTNLKAGALFKIGIAIAVLAAALLVLSTIDPKDMTKALAAMSTGFGLLVGSLVALMKFMGPVGVVQIYVVSTAMAKMAISILLLSFALKTLAGIKFGSMVRGLVGLSATLFIINKAMTPLAAGSKGMVRAAGAIVILGLAMNILAVALKIFGSMSWEEMGRGLLTMAGALTVIAITMKMMPKGILLQAAAILVLSAALNAMGIALKVMGTISWDEMGRGLTVLGASLAIIAAAMRLMPKGMLFQAAAILILSTALTVLAGAVKIMGSMGWESIGKGLTVLAGSLVILAVALKLMGGTAILGAAALVVAAGALAVLTPILITLGSLSWSTIITGLTTLAAIFVVLGAAGYLLAPVVFVIIGLAGALTLIGVGLALAGAGALAFATAFGVIVSMGTAGVQVLADMLGNFITSIPAFMAALGQGMVAFAQSIASSGPKFVQAVSGIISQMLRAVIKNVPLMGKAFMTMLSTGLRVVVTMTPKIIAAGFRLIVGFLAAIRNNIGPITQIAIDIVVKFINTLANNLGRIIQAGVNLIIKFIEGVTQALNNNSERLGRAGGELGIAMVRGMASGIRGAGGAIKDAAMEAARAAWEEVKDFFKIGSPSKLMRDDIGRWIPAGIAVGIKDETPQVTDEINSMGHSAMDTLKRTMTGIGDAMNVDSNLNPTVTPVLDLTKMTKEASRMSSLLDVSPIRPDFSYRGAADISEKTEIARQEALQAELDRESKNAEAIKEIKFEQNNYSPKALSDVEIYRNTKSQLALAREELNV